MSFEEFHRIYTYTDVVENYVKFRPEYPAEIFDIILSFCDQQNVQRQKVIDICCGSGQSINGLMHCFDEVIGVDISEAQINQAKKRFPSVKFHLGPAESLSFQPDASVDLVTCATGYHFVKKDEVLQEVARVLKPNGVFAVYTYMKYTLDREEADSFLQERFLKVFYDQLQVGLNVTALYQDPLPWHGTVRYEGIKLQKTFNISEFLGFIFSSGVLKPMFGDEANIFLSDFRDKLISVYTGDDGLEHPIHVKLPLTLILGRKPNDAAYVN